MTLAVKVALSPNTTNQPTDTLTTEPPGLGLNDSSSIEKKKKSNLHFLYIYFSGLPRPRRLLVFVNPKSGLKKGVKVYTTKVLPLLQKYGVSIVDLIGKDYPQQTLRFFFNPFT